MFSREAVRRSSKEWLKEAAASSSSVFIALRKNSPLVISTEDGSSAQLMKLDYSMVKPLLTEENVIYLGVADKNSPSKANRSNSFEMNSTSALGEGNNCQLNSNEVPYFCVDLSNFTEEEVLKLSKGCVETELLHPYRMLALCPDDLMLYSQAWPLVDWNQRYCRCPTCGSSTKMAEGGYKRICQNNDCNSQKGIA